MVLSEYEAKRADLEKKMELSIKYQAECKRIQAQIGQLKHKQREALKNYQNDKAWWHQRYKAEKQDINSKMHLLRLEYLTVNNIDCKETRKKESDEVRNEQSDE